MDELIERLAEVLPPKPLGANPPAFMVTPVQAAEIHNRFARLVTALEAAREDACVALVADIRFACGDNGKRMQPELVEFIRGLAEDAERLDWLDAQRGDDVQGSYPDEPQLVGHYWSIDGQCTDVRTAIDQARGKGGEGVAGG